jgi:hydroxymethylglutaryl-CoA synthase
MMKQMCTSAADYDYVVLHMPNGKFPSRAGQLLGFSKEKILPALIVTKVGNSYSASSMSGLAAVLDCAKGGERILMTSYGSGAGSDAFSILVKDRITEVQRLAPSIAYYINRRESVDYAMYSKFRRQLKGFAE